MEMKEKKRSVGIILVGVIFIILSMVSLIPALLGTVNINSHGDDLKDLLADRFMRFIFILPLLASVASAVGLLCFKEFGRICSIVTSIGMPLLLCVYVLLMGGSPAALAKCFIFACFVGVLFSAPIIFYLTRPKVKAQFK